MSVWLLAAAVLGSAVALGSLHTTVLVVVTVLLAAAVAIGWLGREPTRMRPVATLVLGSGLLLVVWTTVQAVPLPHGLVAAVAPENADIWARALSPLGEPGPSAHPISVDPIATRVQVLRGIAYLLAFLGALYVAARTERTFLLEATLVVSGIVVSVAALIHPALGLEKVFGIYSSAWFGAGNRLGPLLNANHLAAYVNIAICVSLAMGVARTPRIPRLIPLAACAVLVGIQVWIGSRGGMVAMLLGVALVVWMSRAAGIGRKGPLLWAVLTGILLAIGVGLFVLAASEKSMAELSSTDTTKLDLIKRAAFAARSFLWTGMGRGAFESVFPAYRNDHEGHVVFTHPENLPVQWVSEWGLPVSVLAFAGLAYALRPSSALARSVVPAGPWAAVVATAVHNLVDFNLEVPAIGIAVAVCAAAVVGGSAVAESRRSRMRWWPKRPGVLVVAGGAAALIASVVALSSASSELRYDREHLRYLGTHAAADRARFVAAARVAMLRHPAEPYLPFMGAVRVSIARDESIMPWINRTLERAAVYGRAHLVLARWLVHSSRGQARMEYRLAMEQDPAIRKEALAEGIRLIDDFEGANELVPETPFELFARERIADGIRLRLPASAVRLDEETSAKFPRAVTPVQAQLVAALADLRAGEAAPWCATDRAGCVKLARDASVALVKIAPESCESHQLAAEVLIADGQKEKALDGLADAVDQVQNRGECLRTLVTLAAKVGSQSRLTRALDHVNAAGCGSVEECVDVYLFVAGFEEERGNHRIALAFVKRAFDRAPQRTDLLERIAALASRVGLHGEAMDAYEKLASLNPRDAERWRTALARERAALLSRQVSEQTKD